MIAAEVAKRYAHGLFLLALEKNLIDRLAEEMRDLDNLLSADKSLLRFLAAPQVRDHDKFAVMRNVFSGKVSREFEEFLMHVVTKRRNPYLRDIAEAFENLVLEYRGYVKTKVVTAVPMDEKQKETLARKLESKTRKRIMLRTAVDPSIIGGVVVFLGDKIIDMSIRYRLSVLRDQLQALKVH
ncbi:MAG: ATP synthase F1 subunit delta [candidate division Zixibacteria bacterium]|nr:ATP synthase F1 subunit delta [candidate division Zixibacteria bacterium]MBU1471712.1 ATP synthase F1 subunit delta [candidate division Zixibacteria bacterium]MBU2624598.1 ATP synthase F1 subunit delta [candidate division Zixibacteria bacterium]